VNINNNIDTRTGGTNGDVLVKSSADISLATTKSIKTTGGDVVLWSNSDNESANGSILLYGASSITTSGGHLWMAGGANSATPCNGLNVGDGYAVSGTTISGTGNAANFGKVGVFMEEATLSTGGGDIYIRGKTTTFRGFLVTGTVGVNAGAGKIYIEGQAVGDGGGSVGEGDWEGGRERRILAPRRPRPTHTYPTPCLATSLLFFPSHRAPWLAWRLRDMFTLHTY
jgi:hypothetical protein